MHWQILKNDIKMKKILVSIFQGETLKYATRAEGTGKRSLSIY